jgi:Na+/phosphate symporter
MNGAIPWYILITAGLLGGLAFFLLGLKMLSDGLKSQPGKDAKCFQRLTITV